MFHYEITDFRPIFKKYLIMKYSSYIASLLFNEKRMSVVSFILLVEL